MIKLGRKLKDMLGSPMMAAQELDDDEIRYPSVYLDHLDGDLNGIEVGESVTLVGKVVSKKVSEREKGEPYYCFDIEVHKLDAKGVSKDLEDDDEDDDEDDEDDDEDSDQKAVRRGLDKAAKNKDKSNGY